MNKDIQKAKELKVILEVGKKGITENFLKEVKLLLDVKKIIKIKLRSTFIDEQKKNKKELMELIANKTNSTIIKKIGLTFVLKKN